MLCRAAVCVLLLAGVAGQALADANAGKRNALLKGFYRVTTEVACTTSDQGFGDPPGLQALGTGGPVIDHDTGTIFFDGQGNAIETRHGISISPQPVAAGSSPASTYQVTCRYTYSVNVDKSFTLSGSCTGTVTTGPAAGLTVDVSPAGGAGQLSESRTMFTVSGVEAVQQTLTLSNGFHTKRLCGASTTGVRVHHQ